MARLYLIIICQAFVVFVGISGEKSRSIHVEDLLTRIEALERQGHVQSLELRNQKHLNEYQDKQLNDLRATVQIQNKRIYTQADVISGLRDRIGSLEAELVQRLWKDKDELDEIQVQSKTTEWDEEPPTVQAYQIRNKETSLQKRRIHQKRDYEGPVTFLVRATHSDVHLGLNQNVLFDTIVSNIGNAYHQSHGLFIAPAPGVYLFSTSINSFPKPQNWLEAEIVKNGALLSRALAYSDAGRDQGSVTVTTQLAAGDEVWVRIHYPNTEADVWGDAFSSFTGCLVMPI